VKVIVDNKIPYIQGVLEPYAEVVYLPGHLTNAGVVKDADALLTRTRTICDRQTLEGSKVKLIATATIGFDHIDTGYCEQAGIKWLNAPGCNAESVNQYIASALLSYSTRHGLSLKGKTMGVVGVGQVGSRIARTCEILGMKVLLNDPPRERREGSAQFSSLQTIQQQADVISFHVPLNRGGPDNTFHLADRRFLQNLGAKPLLINTCRGEVFNTEDILKASESNGVAGLIIDCWENEPRLDLNLLNRVDYGTSHIAGYSKDGKANGTTNSVRVISQFFGMGIDDWEPSDVEPPAKPVFDIDGQGKDDQMVIAEAVFNTFKIENDDQVLRANPDLFEQLRGDYPVRREFGSHSIKLSNCEAEVGDKLKRLGFVISEPGE
jgi:erythronate-4-phosphate dehydrogenase